MFIARWESKWMHSASGFVHPLRLPSCNKHLPILNLNNGFPLLQENKADLIDSLFSPAVYDSRDIPRPSDGGPLMVDTNFHLRQVVHLDCAKQLLTTGLWISHKWTDDRLRWNTTDYNGTSSLVVPASMVWLPDVMLLDNANMNYEPTVETSLSVTITHNGRVSYFFPGTYQSTCRVYMTYFPFDHHTCYLRFASWIYDSSELDIRIRETGSIGSNYYKENNEWKLVGLSAVKQTAIHHDCCDEPFADVTCELTIQRHSRLYFNYLYLPNILFLIITVLQFLLPCDSSEKVILAAGIILCLSMYLLLMTKILPVSDSLPLIMQFMTVTFVLVIMSLVLTVLVCDIHHGAEHHNHQQLPHWVRVLFLHIVARLLMMDKFITSDEEHEQRLHSEECLETVNLVDDEATASSMNLMNSKNSQRSLLQSSSALLGKPNAGRDNRVSIISCGNASIEATNYGQRVNIKMTMSELAENVDVIFYKILKHLETHVIRRKKTDADVEVVCEWEQMAMVANRLFAVIYAFIVIVLWFVIFLNQQDVPQFNV